MRIAGSVWASALLLSIGAGAQAAPCPADLRPTDLSYGYRHRTGPDRCEGLYASPVAGEGLQVMSFTLGRLADSGKSGPVQIGVPDLHGLPASASPQIVVVGRALALRVYYRLDAVLRANETLAWPVDQVVIPAGLQPSEIGLLGMAQTQQGTIYVPLTLSGGPTATDAPQIVFRAPLDLDNFQWRVFVPGEAEAWHNVGPKRAGDAVLLTLDQARSGAVSTLEVAAKPAGMDYIQSRFRIYRP